MLKAFLTLTLFFMTFAPITNAHAQVPSVVSEATRKAQYQMLNRFSRGIFNDETQVALDNAVRFGVTELAEAGFEDLAKQIWQEWRKNYSHLVLSSTEKVGDHAPLYAWLNNYYKVLEARLGRRRCEKMHLNDIPIMNFVIPVAIQPGGDVRNGDHWPMPEYRRHFVPFASITSYWLTYGVCRSNTPGGFKLICERVAMIFKNSMKEHVAPQLADFIYERWGHGFNGEGPLDFRALDQYYAGELAKVSTVNP